MRYKVAVADDEKSVVENLSVLLEKYSDAEKSKGNDVEFAIDTFNSGDDLLESLPESYDIILLDINMPGTNGLETARRLRAANCRAALVFGTNYAQYAVKGYEVNAIGYLLKPIEESAFRICLERAISAVNEAQALKIRIKTAQGVDVAAVNEIEYVEVRGHNLFFNVSSTGKPSVIRTRGAMSELCDELCGYGFSRCSLCYLVNLHKVTAVRNKTVFLRGGAELPISRKFLKAFTSELMKFLGSSGAINV